MSLQTGKFDTPDGVAGSYLCSSGMDQINAVMGACRPSMNQNLDDFCGSYRVDLSDKNTFTEGRTVKTMPMNASCSYHVYSKCGYPEV